MSYEHKSNVRGRGIPIPLRVISITAIILLLLNLFFPQFLGTTFTFVARPFWDVEQAIRDIENPQIPNPPQEILAGNTPTTTAYIIKKPPFTVYDSYIIDVKKKDVQVGDKVYAIGNVLVGEIVEIHSGIAKVKLYSSYGEKYNVFIGKGSIETVATGLGGGSFEVVLPKDVKVQENDIVTIPDLSPSQFGIVKRVTIDPARAFSTILFSQPINIYEQQWVLIQKK